MRALVIFCFVTSCVPSSPQVGVRDPVLQPVPEHGTSGISVGAEQAILITEDALRSERRFDKANRPFRTKRKGTFWIVNGTITSEGAPEVHVNRTTGRVVRVIYRFQPRTHFAPLTKGAIPDAATAIRVAQAVWKPQRDRATNRPKATLAEGIWTVVDGDNSIVLSLKNGSVLSRIESTPIVRDESMALSVANAVLATIYGHETLRRQKPLAVGKRNGNWIVEGTLPPSTENIVVRGGVAHIVIRADDAKVLQVTHGR